MSLPKDLEKEKLEKLRRKWLKYEAEPFSWAKRLYRFFRLHISSLKSPILWKKKSAEEIGAMSDLEVGSLTDIEIIKLGDNIRFLPLKGINNWSAWQLSSLQTSQIQNLTPDQLKVILHGNEDLTPKVFGYFVTALCRDGHYHKLGDLLHLLRSDPIGREKLNVLIMDLKSLPRSRLKRALIVYARTSADEQFERLLKEFEFKTVWKLFKSDIDGDGELNSLRRDVETMEFENTLKYQEFEQQLGMVERLHRISSIDTIIAIFNDLKKQESQNLDLFRPHLSRILSDIKEVYKELKEKVKLPNTLDSRLMSLVHPKTQLSSEQLIVTLGKLNLTLYQLERDLKIQKRNLLERNMKLTNFVEYWKDWYLPKTYQRAIDSIEHEGEGWKDNLKLRSHLQELLKRAESDLNYIEESYEWFSRKTRLEYDLGEFTTAFFERMIRFHSIHYKSKAITSKKIEALLLMPGMLDLLSLYDLVIQVETIKDNLYKRLLQAEKKVA